jgi:hypothetical protein
VFPSSSGRTSHFHTDALPGMFLTSNSSAICSTRGARKNYLNAHGVPPVPKPLPPLSALSLAVSAASPQHDPDQKAHKRVHRGKSQSCQQCRASNKQRKPKKRQSMQQRKARKRAILGESSGNARKGKQPLTPPQSSYEGEACDVALCKEGPC